MGQQREPKPGAESRGVLADAPVPPPVATTGHVGHPWLARWPPEAYAIALLLATVLAYLPAFSADFIRWDDQYYVEDSHLLPDPDALSKIWNPWGHDTQQYYPLVFSTYWLEYRLWGIDPHSYHVVNVGLHAINALLVLSVGLELGVSTALAATTAAIFALHPAQVASVAWISELKNTLSGFFALLAMLAYVRHRRTGVWSAYGLCLLAFTGALLSKTQTATLPVSLLLVDWALQRLGHVRRAAAAGVAGRVVPMFALGALAGVITLRFEQMPWTRTFTLVERLLVSANAAVFYARTLFAPFWLSPVYPEWRIVVSDWRWWIAPGICVAAAGTLLLGRRRIPELALWGIGHFYIALVPVLGLFSFNFQTYTFVADHFLYLSVLGGGLAIAVAVERASSAAPLRPLQPVIAAGLALLLAGCGVLTYTECTHWRSNLSFWTRVRDRDPDGFLGNYNLGNHYRAAGQWPQAVVFYRRAADIRPAADYPFAHYADALEHASGPQAVIDMCTQRLSREPGFYVALLERGLRHEQLGHVREALQDYEGTLQLAPRGSAAWQEAQRRRTRLASQHGSSG
jgi:hypothetical protein